MERLRAYRSEFPVAETTTYLNQAAVSPVPLRTQRAVKALFHEFSHEGIARFPANIYPWMHLERRGVRVRFYERKHGRFGVPDVERALAPGTRLLTVSSVDFASGFACDLEALGAFCEEKGLLFFVDAIQGLGPCQWMCSVAGSTF